MPSGYVPAKSQYLIAGGTLLLIAGPAGFNGIGISIPAGAVYTPGGVVFLDGVEFDPAGSKVVIAKTAPAKVKASGQWEGGDPLKLLANR